MLIPIETKRLILRPFVEGDEAELFLLDSNPEVMKYLGMAPLQEVSESKMMVEMIMKQYETYNVGRFAVIEKESNRLIGWTGLKFNTNTVNGYQDFYEIGYRYLPEFWGKGYAMESTLPFVHRAFEEMDVEVLYAYAHVDNKASLHVLKKLGFTENGSFEEPDGTCIWFDFQKQDFVEK